MLRNLRATRDGKKILGLPFVGVLGSEVPGTGDDSRPSLLYNDVQVNNLQSSRVKLWITSHTFPALFVDDFGYWTATGLTDGTYTADGVLIVDGVDQGLPGRILTLQVGAASAVSTASPFTVALTINPVAGAYSIGQPSGVNYQGSVTNLVVPSGITDVIGAYSAPELIGLTSVEFSFVLPTGLPVINAVVEVQLTGSGFNQDMTGILMPRPFLIVLDAEGKAIVPLWPTATQYVVVATDIDSEAVLSYRFVVPRASTGTVLRLQDLVI